MAMSGEGSLKRFHTWLVMSWPISPVMIHDHSLWLAPWGSLRLLGRYSDPYKEVSPHNKQIPGRYTYTHAWKKSYWSTNLCIKRHASQISRLGHARSTLVQAWQSNMAAIITWDWIYKKKTTKHKSTENYLQWNVGGFTTSLPAIHISSTFTTGLPALKS